MNDVEHVCFVDLCLDECAGCVDGRLERSEEKFDEEMKV